MAKLELMSYSLPVSVTDATPIGKMTDPAQGLADPVRTAEMVPEVFWVTRMRSPAACAEIVRPASTNMKMARRMVFTIRRAECRLAQKGEPIVRLAVRQSSPFRFHALPQVSTDDSQRDDANGDYDQFAPELTCVVIVLIGISDSEIANDLTVLSLPMAPTRTRRAFICTGIGGLGKIRRVLCAVAPA